MQEQKTGFYAAWYCGLAAAAFFFGGCATPTGGLSRTTVLAPDADDNIGGSFLESGDIRTIASQMAPKLLGLPEIAEQGNRALIAIAPVRNSTRHVIDKELFTKRLRLELNRVSEGRVRFLSQGLGQNLRSEILTDQQEARWDHLLDTACEALLAAPPIQTAKTVTIAVIPVKNTNLADINADSFTALLRAKIAEKSGGKILFLSREANGKVIEQILDEKDLKDQKLVSGGGAKELFGVDYFLSGEFIAQSMMTESATKVVETKTGRSDDDPGVVETSTTESKKAPNVTKYLNIKLIDAATAAVPFEKLLLVDSKIRSGVGRAAFILTGELSALSKAAAGGDRSDYVMMSFQLVDPASNEILWEDAYETKKKTRVSVLYK